MDSTSEGDMRHATLRCGVASLTATACRTAFTYRGGRAGEGVR
ncbi:DUF6380 family protein [Streptomyces griseosporeus]